MQKDVGSWASFLYLGNNKEDWVSVPLGVLVSVPAKQLTGDQNQSVLTHLLDLRPAGNYTSEGGIF